MTHKLSVGISIRLPGGADAWPKLCVVGCAAGTQGKENVTPKNQNTFGRETLPKTSSLDVWLQGDTPEKLHSKLTFCGCGEEQITFEMMRCQVVVVEKTHLHVEQFA